MMKERAITHLNIIGFKAAVATVKDKSLKDKPFVIAGATGGRSIALDCSPEAVRQGVTPGTAIALAERKINDLTILPPDPASYELMNKELEKVAERYAPLWENDRQGNLYLDLTGTSSLFGRSVDCTSRILRDILEQADIRPAAAVASNKLVSKVATRSIRPMGFMQVLNGTEADFLSHQDIHLLPGMGAKLMKTAAVVGIREIGEIACLSEGSAISLFGKHGVMLRNMALGIDNSPVLDVNGKQRILQQADFNEDVIDGSAVQGAILSLAEHGGLEMRRNKLGATVINLTVNYADGMSAEGTEKGKRSFVLDKDIGNAAYRIFKKVAVRRIRIRSLGLSLESLVPLGYEVDLFEPENEEKERHLQEAVDVIQNKFGAGKITRGIVLAAMNNNGKKKSAGLLNAN
jgi:DNA polymerase-4